MHIMFVVLLLTVTALASNNYKKPFIQTVILCLLYCTSNYLTVVFIDRYYRDITIEVRIYSSLLLLAGNLLYYSELFTLIPEKYKEYLVKSLVVSNIKNDD